MVKIGCEKRSAPYVVHDESHNKEFPREISNLSDHQQQCLANIRGNMVFHYVPMIISTAVRDNKCLLKKCRVKR